MTHRRPVGPKLTRLWGVLSLAHQKKMVEHGAGIITFEKVPFCVESSGAFGKMALAFWGSVKAAAREAKL